ncbi:hypothetical protein DBV15_04474 [Temnothorax longispinosus]|uniref:Uncharacterized protein n=1 Tax=Temnothorax longispinosus TaxID=300112 RepID=A0A4S2KCE4_9HYME|nr:hypothetical protein DBV15_04474 [Temnothorax longispinosus]
MPVADGPVEPSSTTAPSSYRLSLSTSCSGNLCCKLHLPVSDPPRPGPETVRRTASVAWDRGGRSQEQEDRQTQAARIKKIPFFLQSTI